MRMRCSNRNRMKINKARKGEPVRSRHKACMGNTGRRMHMKRKWKLEGAEEEEEGGTR